MNIQEKDNADTTESGCWLGEDGEPHQMEASGTRIHLPLIEGDIFKTTCH